MSKLQPFLIAEFKSGLDTYLEPWIRPNDAFDPLVNAYTNRGTLNKRNGSTFYGSVADANPIMGIMNYINETTGESKLVVASTTNLYLWNGSSFDPLVTVGGANSVFWTGTATGTVIIDTFWPSLSPTTVTITNSGNNLTFDAGGAQNSAAVGIFSTGSTIDYVTGIVTINFAGSTPNSSLSIAATLVTPSPGVGAVFTGNNTNFFNWTNWQPTNSVTFVNSVSYLWMTNDVDAVTIFDGTNLSRPILYVDPASTIFITNTLDIQVYQNRMLYIKPTLLNTGTSVTSLLNQSIFYSAQFNPFNVINGVAGNNGGEVTAPTGDIIMSDEFLRNDLIVFFSRSTWKFRFTGSFSDPFRWDKLNVSKRTNCQYASVPYDERCTALGAFGHIACDGNSVQRYDVPIIDYYETIISSMWFGQTFSQRYDNLQQTWMLYVSNGTANPVVGTGAPGSDSALIYNFLENSWATYTFIQPMTCLGTFLTSSGVTWQQLMQYWQDTTVAWNSYGGQALAPQLLGGDVNGNVYIMDNPLAVTDFSSLVTGEVIAVGDGVTVTFTGTLANPPIESGSLTVTDTVETFSDVGNGTLIGNLGGTGTINYQTGAYSITFHTAPANMRNITATYIHGYVILPNITSTRWNPIMNLGQKNQFAYIDVYYSVDSESLANPVQLTLSFSVDNKDGDYAAVRTLTLDGPVNSDFAFKRVYVNLIGEFIEMNIDPSENASFEIAGFILWVNPSGRLTGGVSL